MSEYLCRGRVTCGDNLHNILRSVKTILIYTVCVICIAENKCSESVVGNLDEDMKLLYFCSTYFPETVYGCYW